MRIVMALALITVLCVLFCHDPVAAATATISAGGGGSAVVAPLVNNGGGGGGGGGVPGGGNGGGGGMRGPAAEVPDTKWDLPPIEKVKEIDEKRFDALLTEVALDAKQQERAYELKNKLTERGADLTKQQDAAREAYGEAKGKAATAAAARQVQEVVARIKKFDPDADYRFGMGHILNKEQWAKFKALEKERVEAAAKEASEKPAVAEAPADPAK